jgi:hypothetical protein
MDNLQLQQRLAGLAHRSDLTNQLPLFIEDARERINRRFALQLVPLNSDTDTNDVLSNYPLLYVYASAQSMYEYLNNGDNAMYYDNLWERECDRQNVLNPYTVTDHYTLTNPPVILNPAEQAIIANGGT